MLRYSFVATAALLIVGAISPVLQAAQSAQTSQYAGAWSGGWEGGGGSGSFGMTLKDRDDGSLGGEVAVGTDAGDYASTITSISFDGNKMTARYDYTPDPQAEIVLVATFEGSKASGEWTMVPKGQDGPPFSAGTWQVEKK